MAVLSVELRDLAPVANRHAEALELVDEVVRHRLGKVGASVEQGDERAATREPDSGLAGRVPAAENGDPRAAAQLSLRRPGGVEDAHTSNSESRSRSGLR